jgi:hypothetical protein
VKALFRIGRIVKEGADPPCGIASGLLYLNHVSAKIAQDFAADETFFICEIQYSITV